MLERNEEGQERSSGGRAAHRDERRRTLVIAAYQLIAEKGFEHLRTRDVAAKVHVNIATLHYYFASKEELIHAVVDHLLEEFRAAPEPAHGQAGNVVSSLPLAQVQGMFLETYQRFRERPEMFVVLSELVLRSLRDPSIQYGLQYLDENWHTYLRDVILTGVQQGTFRTDIHADSMASGLILLIKGFFFHQITSPGSLDMSEVLADIERLLLP